MLFSRLFACYVVCALSCLLADASICGSVLLLFYLLSATKRPEPQGNGVMGRAKALGTSDGCVEAWFLSSARWFRGTCVRACVLCRCRCACVAGEQERDVRSIVDVVWKIESAAIGITGSKPGPERVIVRKDAPLVCPGNIMVG